MQTQMPTSMILVTSRPITCNKRGVQPNSLEETMRTNPRINSTTNHPTNHSSSSHHTLIHLFKYGYLMHII